MRAKRDVITGLTPKEESFCHAYISNGGNATSAYEEAFGRGKKNYNTLAKSASVLSKEQRIITRIQVIRDERVRASVISREDYTRLMLGIATFDTGRLFKKTPDGIDVPKSMSELSEDERRMIQGWDKNGMPVLIDKMQAMKQVASVNGLNTANRVEISVGGKLGQLLGGHAIPAEGEVIDEDYSYL